MHIVCCLPVFVIDSFLPWQSGNTEQFISFPSVFLCSFQQGLTPEVPAPKAAAAADKKHSSVSHCNGDSLFVDFERIFVLQSFNTVIQTELVVQQWGINPCLSFLFQVTAVIKLKQPR